jgi:DNA-binding NtrC family response regulator
MNQRHHPTETWDSEEEDALPGLSAPRIIRFFRADDPFDPVEEFALTSPGLMLGREASCLPGAVAAGQVGSCHDSLMSSHHATIVPVDGGHVISDANSKNGTFVNTQRITTPHRLADGDIIECGHSFFIYRSDNAMHGTTRHVLNEDRVAVPPLLYQMASLLPYVTCDAAIHLHGETGTGKEVVARAIHDLSGRSGLFVARNCAAIPDNLFESELFGYVKGAFSGASIGQRGQIVAADGGTLFLDEIGELSLNLQAKLLRVLELKEVLPLGASTAIPVDFRLVSATLQDLRHAVTDGKFRADLYGRLGHTFEIPSLRQHKEEIGRLVSAFLGAAITRKRESGQPTAKVYFTLAAARALVAYGWPFNVRELKRAIENALIAAMSETPVDGFCAIRLAHLPIPVDPSGGCEPSAVTVLPREPSELTDRRLLEALRAAEGNRAETAKLLGVSQRTVFRRLRKLRIAEGTEEESE